MTYSLRFAALTLFAAAAASLAGCSTTTTTTSTNASDTSGFATLARLGAEGSVAAIDLAPGHDSSERWTSLQGLLAPGEFVVTTAGSDAAPGASATRTADLETAHWGLSESGELVMYSVDSHPDKTSSLFDPPLLLAPASLAAGEERTATASMRAVFTATKTKERDHGMATRTVRYDRDEEIQWRGARQRAKVVTVRFLGDLGTAKAERSSELWVLPGTGVIAERWDEKLTILKVFTKTSGQFAYRQ